MDYETWEKYKDELRNKEMRIFRQLSDGARVAMRAAQDAGAQIHLLSPGALWEYNGRCSFAEGLVYRVGHDWTGPAKPEPKVEYVDKEILQRRGTIWFDNPYILLSQYVLTTAASIEGFAGYVYLDGFGVERCRARLLFDSQPDGTYRLRVPKAVRFVKP